MNPEQGNQPIKSFNFEGKELPVSFIETTHVNDGVDCDVYSFVDDPSKNLGIKRIKAGFKTPLQKVIKGDDTIEGYLSGKGKLIVVENNGRRREYVADEDSQKPIEVKVKKGEIMQWVANQEADLIAYEICYPPYEDGRFEDLK